MIQTRRLKKSPRDRGEVRKVIAFTDVGVRSSMHAARVAGDEFLIGVTDQLNAERRSFCQRVASLHDFVSAASALRKQHEAALIEHARVELAERGAHDV